MIDNGANPKEPRGSWWGEGSISARFRNYNIALFALAFFLTVMASLAVFSHIIKQVSAGYARSYAASSSDALSAHIDKEIAFMSKAARSSAVIDWLADEGSDEKKLLAYKEMKEIVGGLYSGNLYVVFENSLHEYRMDQYHAAGDIRPFDTLEKDDPDDAWYFACRGSDQDYLLNVNIDRVLQKKRMWLDYRVVHNGVFLGAITTGLEFSHITGELFSRYDEMTRGLIVDANGVINMDSGLLNNEEYLNHPFEVRLEDQVSDPALLAAVRACFDGSKGYFSAVTEPEFVEMPGGQYRYATIAPVRFTNWLAVILYDSPSSLNMSLFLPVLATMLVLLVAFALASSAMSSRLIFSPLKQLVGSLARMKENRQERIYGLERKDEFGSLSNTIHDLFTQANYDALTGLYNRRFMEINLRHIMEFFSRSNGCLSVFMIDVDYFKKYNDAYGHEEGDACLKQVAQALARSITRTNDFVARYGGEEFLVALPNTNVDGARLIAQKLLDNVRQLNIPHKNSTVAPCVTVSVGFTTGRAVYRQNWESYVKRADEALYMSKQTGRDKYTYLEYTGSPEEENPDGENPNG